MSECQFTEPHSRFYALEEIPNQQEPELHTSKCDRLLEAGVKEEHTPYCGGAVPGGGLPNPRAVNGTQKYCTE